MAGVRHHILPRFLLKGFASRIKGQESFTWVYRKSAKPFETNIVNVSVEKHFYGRDGETSADAEITDMEGEFASLIEGLRAKDARTEVLDSRIPYFIAHLSIRTKHLRDSFRYSTEYLMEQMTAYLSDFDNFKKLLLSNPKLMKEELVKVLDNVPAPQWQKEMLLPLVEHFAPALIDNERALLEMMLQSLIEEIKPVIPKAIKESHIKLLAKDSTTLPRADDYGKLKWFVACAESPIILGDIGCMFETANARRFKPIDDKGDKVVSIYLPLSSHQILVGTSFSSLPQIDYKTLNKATVKCSYEFFICSESSTDKASLAPSIGAWSGILSKKELEQIASEIIHDIDKTSL